MDVIDLTEERERRTGPDSQFVQVIDGVKWFKYAASYTTGDGSFSITFWATGFDDANSRVAAMRELLKLDGQLYSEVEE